MKLGVKVCLALYCDLQVSGAQMGLVLVAVWIMYDTSVLAALRILRPPIALLLSVFNKNPIPAV